MKTRYYLLAASLAATMTVGTSSAYAQATEPFIGQLALVGFNFCPRGWIPADGQLLSISQNTALFSLFGTMYGGDGRTTFGVPDLRGRVPISAGNGPGLPQYIQGSSGGSTSFTITTNNMPSHSHTVNATNQPGNLPGPGTDFLARNNTTNNYHNGPPAVTMDPGVIGNTGGGVAIDKRSPFQTLLWCVSLTGIFPSRN